MTTSNTPARHRLFLRLAFTSLLLFVPVTLVVALPSTARAQGNDDARERFMEGRELYEDGEYLEAAEKFLEAYRLSDRSELLYNVGQAYRRADALARAEEYFQRYLNEQPDASNADSVVETIIEIQRELAARMATVTVETAPNRADIFIDDETSSRCQSPCDIDLDPGSYRLRAERAGYISATTTVDLEARENADAAISLDPESSTGDLLVRSDISGATLFAEGRSYPVPTTRPIELTAGSQDIVLQWDGGKWDQTIEIADGETLHLFVPAALSGSGISPLRTAAIGLGGVGVALAGAGFLMGSQASASHEALQTQRDDFGEVNPQLLQTGRSQQTSANVLLISSVISIGAGAGLWIWDMMSSGSDEEPARLEPTPEPEEDSPGIELL